MCDLFHLSIHEAFDTLILNKSVLEVAFVKVRRYKNNCAEVKEMTLKLVIFFVLKGTLMQI